MGSLPVGSFRLLVQPEKGGGARSLRPLNNLKAGDETALRASQNSGCREAKGAGGAGAVASLTGPGRFSNPKAAGKPAEWKVPADTAVVALVFGPRGLNVNKVKSLVGRNEEMLAQLADYAEQTEKIETLVEAVAKSEASGRECRCGARRILRAVWRGAAQDRYARALGPAGRRPAARP